jgi:hypothetical protein
MLIDTDRIFLGKATVWPPTHLPLGVNMTTDRGRRITDISASSTWCAKVQLPLQLPENDPLPNNSVDYLLRSRQRLS